MSSKKSTTKQQEDPPTKETMEEPTEVADITNMNIIVNGTNDLICAKCFMNGEENGAIGICKDCKHYLCGTCTLEHHNDPGYKKHKYAFFYCDRQMRANQLQRANSFCLDCGHYLCTKCALDHGGYREYRHHTLIGGRHVDIPAGLDAIDAGLRRLGRSNTFTYGIQSRDQVTRRATRRTQSTSRERVAPVEEEPETPTRPSKLTVQRKHKQSVDINESVTTKARTLIQSTTGRRPQTDTPISRAQNAKNNSIKRPKTVRYEDQQIAKPGKLLGEFDLKGPSDKKQCDIVTSLNLRNDKLVVADYGNKKLKLFDSHYKLTSSYTVQTLPIALCQSNGNSAEFYASSGRDIFLLDASHELKLVQTLCTDVKTVEGLTTWSGGIALVFTGRDSKTDKKRHWEVHLLDFSGHVKYELAVRPPFSVRRVTPIWHITSCKSGEQIIISDTFNNRIVCIDIAHWHVVYVIKGRDAGGSPTCLMTDKNGYIHVTWYGEIHKFSETGVDLGVSVTKIGKNAAISYSADKECVNVCPDKDTKRNKLCVYINE